MSIFSFLKTDTKRADIILDIGSKSVGGGIYEIDSDGRYRLLYSTREPISFHRVLTGEKLLQAMSNSLDLVLVHLAKYGFIHVNANSKFVYKAVKIVAILSSPWHVSETKTIKFSQGKTFLVTKNIVDGLVEKAEKDFRSELNQEHKGISELEMLEHKTIEIKLNGYVTEKPYNKAVDQLELSIFTSSFTKHLREKIEYNIFKHFSHQKIEFHSFSLVAFTSVRDFFPELDQSILVQVGGEVTDVTVIKKNIIVDVVSFPLGHNNLLRSLSKICNTHPNCVLESMIKLHLESKINASEKQRVNSAISEAGNSWLELLNAVILGISKKTFLPRTVFLFEESQYSPLFDKFIAGADFSQSIVGNQPFMIKSGLELEHTLSGNSNSISADAILSMCANFAVRYNQNRLV